MILRPATHLALIAMTLVMLPVGALLAGRAPVEAIQAQREIPEDRLLDVGVQVFAPGLPTDEDGRPLPEADLEEMNLFPQLRRSEGRYIAFHLSRCLEETGHWGAVRVIPRGLATVDLVVSGEIKQSTGKQLVVQVEAHDSTGRRWLRQRFKEQADPYAYDDDNPEPFDPYENVYNRIANRLLAAQKKMQDKQIRAIRDVSRIRFAADLAPDAFNDYLSVNKRGRYRLTKMPAAGDPMLQRVDSIRERDYAFIDTLNDYYADFCTRMDKPYDNWREYSYEEQVALAKMRRQGILSQVLGGLLIVGGVAADNGGGSGGRVARDAAVVGGAMAVEHGISKLQESKMHVEALRELAASFDAEVEPLLIDVEGQTLQLTGSVEAQYANWRRLLKMIFATETGLPLDLNEQPQAPAPATETAGSD